MHVILSTTGPRRWISGIFREPQDAHEWLTRLPSEGRVHHSLECILPTQFPFFILEDHSGFRFLDASDATRLVEFMPHAPPNADPILFAILAEFRPNVAGRDEMGCLPHVHLDQEHLAELREHGLRALTR